MDCGLFCSPPKGPLWKFAPIFACGVCRGAFFGVSQRDLEVLEFQAALSAVVQVTSGVDVSRASFGGWGQLKGLGEALSRF